MKEVRYWLAEDNTMFDDEYDCIRYERKKKLENCKDDFIFYDEQKNIIFPEDATNAEEVSIVVIKTPDAAKYVGDWFNSDGCEDPFDGVYCECVGTWVYGDVIDRGDEWLKLELEIEKLQTLIAEVNYEK